jgi:Flp pilus assembly pilin Flp
MTMNTKREIKASTVEEILIDSFVAILVLSAAVVVGGALLGTFKF